MWQRIRRELLIEYYWWRRHSRKKRYLDSSLGLMGILIIISGIAVMVFIGQAIAVIFRNMIPFVGGAQIAGVYWYSVTFALKMCLALLILFVSIIGFLIFKFARNR